MVEYMSPKFTRCRKRSCCPALPTWTDIFLEEMTRNADRVFYFDEGRSYDEAYFESLSKSAEEPDHPRGLDMIKLPWAARK